MRGPLFPHPHRGAFWLWGALAAANLGAGLVRSSSADRISDLETTMPWGRTWLVDGENIYFRPEWGVDYPPNAVVLLSPLGLTGLAFLSWTCSSRCVQRETAGRQSVR